jgi:membrane-bound serine protease (ClpP class)
VTDAGLTPAVQIAVLLVVVIVALAVVLRVRRRRPSPRRLVLDTELPAGEGFASTPETDLAWFGKRGTAASSLRPAGIAEIEGERVDVVSDGEFIEPGEPITVVRIDGNRIVVRRLRRTG